MAASAGSDYGGETCSARVSWALNRAGFSVGRGQRNDPSVTFKGVAGDGQNYVVWVPTLQSWLTAVWGAPDEKLAEPAAAVALELTLKPGEVVVFAGPHHSGLIMKGYSDGYVKWDDSVFPVYAWRLP
ncbi:T6SS effector amidase Tae4 family protein [Gordonia sp. CPCC 206044]|uniref:T6SS effector amidase Tae4 family protein n=1 Tax=Gordonia sp. CPCC 206044 TaxID=3140793 RepID=UPI003AF389A2